MKQKKVAALLLTMALCAGMAVPQSIIPFGIETVFAAETNETQSDQDVIKVANEEELVNALKNASTDESHPTIIELQSNITFTEKSLTETTNIKIPDNTYVTIKSAESAGDNPYEITHNVPSTLVNDGNCLLYSNAKSLILQNVIIDGAGSRRCISHYCDQSNIVLNDKAIIRNGKIISDRTLGGSAGGLGIYVSSKNTVLTMNDGSEITGCNFYNNYGSILGRAIYMGQTSATFNMNGGRIYQNNDESTTPYDGMCYAGYGAVFCKGPFNMTGGKIDHNSGYVLGGVYASYNTVISGGEISYNSANAIVDGQSIAQVNTAMYEYHAGGMVFYGSTAKRTLLIENTAKICNNTVTDCAKNNHAACGGGITIQGKGTATMDGGEISGNTSQSVLESNDVQNGSGNGGGVYVKGGNFIMTGGSITKNKAKANASNPYGGNGGGVFVGVSLASNNTAPSFEMKGGEIKENEADNQGKDIYVSNQMNNVTVNRVTQEVTATKVTVNSNVHVSGKLQVDDIFLPSKTEDDKLAALTVDNSLAESTIGISTEKSDLGTVIANAKDGYEGLAGDASAFKYIGADSDSRKIEYSDGKLVLAEKGVAAQDISGAAVEKIPPVTYNGSAFKPEPTVTLDGTPLTAGKDFDYSYRNNNNAGEATVVITGKSPYEGIKEISFTINKLPIGDEYEFVTSKDIPDYTYTGDAVTPEPELFLGETKLEKDTDYELSWSDNTEIGEGTVTVTGKGNFTGEKKLTFTINPADASTVISDGTDLKTRIESLTGTNAENPAVFTLIKNISVEGTIAVPKDQFVEIKGNYKTITASTQNYALPDAEGNAAATGMFVVNDGSSLKLTDYLTLDGNAKERLVYVCKDGVFEAGKNVTMTGGRATDQNVTKEGNIATVSDVPGYGGQCIYNLGTTEFYGTIRDNETKFNGYGVIYNNHAFTLGSGAKIVDVTVYKRGAVYNDINGAFTMEDASISGTVSVVPGQTAGVGAYDKVKDALDAKAIFNYGTFTMKSGEITGNPGDYPTITNSGVFTMIDGKITGNENNFRTTGGNGYGTIYQRRYDITDPDVKQPVFTMGGGEISGNKVMYNGGGLFLADGTFTMDGENAVIRDNTVTSKGNEDNFGSTQYFNNGGGVFVQSGTFELKKGTIEGNQAYLLTENGTQKQAFNGGTWYFNSNGTPSQTGNWSPGQASDKHYGLGAAIYIGSGTLKLSGGNVNGNLSVPLNTDATQPAFKAASGVYVAGEGVVEMSGAPEISDVIYLEKGKNITITDKLTGTSAYTVYQTENDLKLKEDCTSAIGKAVATYKANADGSTAYQKTDGDLFKLYQYDDTYDYAANKAYTHYTAFADDGVYVNIDDIDVKDLKYTFVDSVMTAGVPSYVYNGKAQNVKISAPVEGWLDKSGNTVDAGGSLAFTADQDAIINAGPYNVTVKPDLTKPGGYHYTGETSLQFAITPRDLSVPIYERDEDGNLKKDENGNYIVDRLYETSYSFKDDISYGVNDPADMEYKPASEVRVNLGVLTPTTLVEGTDYEVTYSNNKSGSKENITATITGKGNYQGVLTTDSDTGIKVKDVQTLTTSITEANVTAGDKAFSLGAKSSDNTAKITYESSDETVATVDANGQVTPLSKGTVRITVTAPETKTSRPAQQVVTVNVAPDPVAEQQKADQAAADNVTRLVNNLNTEAMTVYNLGTSEDSVEHVRAAYEALSDAQKKLVTNDTLKKLTDAEQKIKDLQDQKAAIEKENNDKAAAKAVEDMLNALPEADQMNADTYTNDTKAITEASAGYDTLTDEQKAYVSDQAKGKLDAAKDKAEEIEGQMAQDAVDLAKAQAVSDQIEKMPKATEISKRTITDDEAAVKAARAAYDALTDAQKAKVPQEALAALTVAENKIVEVQKAIADAAAAKIPEVVIITGAEKVTAVENKTDGTQGLALNYENGQIIITPGTDTHPIMAESEDKEVEIDKNYIYNTAVASLNQYGEVIPAGLEVAQVFSIDYYVNGDKQEYDDSMYVTFPAEGVKQDDVTVIVLHQHDGKWTQLKVAGHGDGWVKAKFDGFSPAIVLVAHSASEDQNPGGDSASGSNTNENNGSASNTGDNNGSGSNTGGSTDGGSGSGTNTGDNTGSDSGSNTGSDINKGSTGTDNEAAHVHRMSFVPYTAATADTAGNNAYYKCAECGKLFSDENGEHEITLQDVTIPAGTTSQGGTVQSTTSPYATSGQETWNSTGNGTTATPVSSTAATNGVNTPKTGDRTNMPAAYATLLAALAALFGAGFTSRRGREEETE